MTKRLALPANGADIRNDELMEVIRNLLYPSYMTKPINIHYRCKNLERAIDQTETSEMELHVCSLNCQSKGLLPFHR